MGRYLLNRGNAWNEWTTVADGCLWDEAITFQELEQTHKGEDRFYERVARAVETGCSSMMGDTIASCADMLREGAAEETPMTESDFIQKYLTLAPGREPVMPLHKEERIVRSIIFFKEGHRHEHPPSWRGLKELLEARDRIAEYELNITKAEKLPVLTDLEVAETFIAMKKYLDEK